MHTSLQREKILFFGASIILITASVLLHVWKLSSIPRGFYVDEASLAYNAYSILETGKDEHGNSFPVFFKCFGNYQDPVMAYSLVPVIYVFGFEKWDLKLPSVIYIAIASVAFFFLLDLYIREKWLSLLGAFLFSILPWTFPLSRTVIGGYMPMLLGMICGWYFLLRTLRDKSILYAIFAGFSWTITMYAHQIGRPMGVIMLACFAFSFYKIIFKRLKFIIMLIILMATCLVPMTLSILHNPEIIFRRISVIGVWSGSEGIIETLLKMAQRYIEYFSPSFLFISGDRNLRHNTGNSGELFLFLLPFLICGIYMTFIHSRRNPYLRFLLLCILTYPAAAILTTDHMHSTRCMNGAICLSLATMIGFKYFWRSNRKSLRIILAVILFFGTAEVCRYFKDYFGSYPERSKFDFNSPLTDSLKLSFMNLKPEEILYVSKSIFPYDPENPLPDDSFKPNYYIYFLLYGRFDPNYYQRTGTFPPERLIPYKGKTANPGLLLVSNMVPAKNADGKVSLIRNPEPIPDNAELLGEVAVNKSWRLSVFRIPGNWNP